MQHALDWDDVRIFLAVGRAGSLGGAARTLGVHRSTVLRRVGRLEEALGSRLFERRSDGLVLTAAGERLIPHAEAIAEETASIALLADADHGRPAGNIRVGSTLNLAFGLLPPVLARFREAFPEITVDLVGTLDGYSPVHPEDIDIAFRTLGPDTKGHEDMIGRRLGPLPIAIFGSKRYFAVRKPPRTPADLSGHLLLAGAGPLANVPPMRWLAARTPGVEPVYRASSMVLLLAAIREGLGISCLPRYLGETEPALERAFDLPADAGLDLWILRHPHHRDTARMRAFSGFMADALPKRF